MVCKQPQDLCILLKQLRVWQCHGKSHSRRYQVPMHMVSLACFASGEMSKTKLIRVSTRDILMAT